MTANTVTPLELLRRICRTNGWALALRSTGDHERGQTGTIMTVLDVVELGDGANRKAQLAAGELVARSLVGSFQTVEQSAATVLELLARYGARWTRPLTGDPGDETTAA